MENRKTLNLLILFTCGLISCSFSQQDNMSHRDFFLRVDSIGKKFSKNSDSVFYVIKSLPDLKSDTAYIFTKKGNSIKGYLYKYPFKETENVKYQFSSFLSNYNFFNNQCAKSEIFSNMPQIKFGIFVKKKVVLEKQCTVDIKFSLKGLIK